MRRYFLLVALLLSSCLPNVVTPAYSAEGASSTGSFTLTIRGAVARQLSGTAYTTELGAPSSGVTINMGVNEGVSPCVVSLAFLRALRVATYSSFVDGTRPTELSFSSALNCAGEAWTVADGSGRLEVNRADERLVGRFSLLLISEELGNRVQVLGRFNLVNPRA